jgi:nucleoside-diphosphate-sugar epimerase
MKGVLVTGANGFVGQVLLTKLVSAGYRVRATTRHKAPTGMDARLGVKWYTAPDMAEMPIEGCDTVIHLAARVHVMHERVGNPLAEFRRANVDATEQLARRAAASGVRRFVFLSSVKVNGQDTRPCHPFRADDVPSPEDAYALSKLEAETTLRRVAEQTGLEVVIIRPPLVYGPGVKGNFLSLLNWLRYGIPLPLASLKNRRSFVGVDNLCDLIATCTIHPAAANEIFLVSDDHDLSTPELLRLVGDAMGHPARLWPFPPSWLLRGGAMLGKTGMMQRLCGDLQIDMEKTKSMLAWRPPIDLETGLHRIFNNDRIR